MLVYGGVTPKHVAVKNKRLCYCVC